MLHTLDQMFAPAPPVVATGRTWVAIPAFLEAEVAAGASSSSRDKARSAVRGLLRARRLAPENAPICLDWFDRTFPPDGWDHAMSFEHGTWHDYIYRVRPVLERMTGADVARKATRELEDDWSAAGEHLGGLDMFNNSCGVQRLIPIRSTLTNAARREGLRTRDIEDARFRDLYEKAGKGEKRSLRSASALLATIWSSEPSTRMWFPHPITPIVAEGPFRYEVPPQLEAEIDHLVEMASRKRYIRVKDAYEYVSDGTRTNFRTTLNAVTDALIATGRLRRDANGLAAVLDDPDALDEVVGHVVRRVEKGGIVARSATSLMRRLPIILDRNGIASAQIREAMNEVDELREDATKAGMSKPAMRLCRKLIETRSFRNRFLLAHARPRRVAQDILDAAEAEQRDLTTKETELVIRHGVVACFCAFEVGGAPVRVSNFLEMPYGVPEAWIWRKGNGFEVAIPGAHTKNREEIRFAMRPTAEKWCDTLTWFLTRVRPLMLKDGKTGEIRSSPWFVPMLSDSARPCPYETFHGWFVKIMRDVVKAPCLPHNYRHGQASLLYHNYPDRLGWIARRLGDTEATVVLCYAWVHQEKAMAEGQNLISDLINRN